MNEYISIEIDIVYLDNTDIVTASNVFDASSDVTGDDIYNNFED